MSLPLPSFPHHIQLAIAQKLPIRDYLNFCESSRCSFKVAESVKTKIFLTKPGEQRLTIFRRYSDDQFEIKIESGFVFVFGSAIRFELDYATLQGYGKMPLLTNFFMTTNSSIRKLRIETFRGDNNILNDLLHFGKVKDLDISYFSTMPSFSYFPAMKQLDSLFACCNLNDSDLLELLNAKDLTLFNTRVTGLGINTFIKEVVSKKRRLEYMLVQSDNDFAIGDILSSVPILSDISSNAFYREEVKFIIGAETKYSVGVMRHRVIIQRIPN